MPGRIISPPPSGSRRSPRLYPSTPPLPSPSIASKSPSPRPRPSPRRSSSSVITSLPPSPSGHSRESSASSIDSPYLPLPPTSKTRDKLLPAIPLTIDTHLKPRPRRQHRSERHHHHIHAVIDSDISPIHGSAPSQPDQIDSTPPRPRRRQTSGSEYPSHGFLAPTPAYLRASSPASISTSASTISDLPTPRPRIFPEPPAPDPPADEVGHISNRSTSLPRETPPARKRDSHQRRLSALRGLVANLDFNQNQDWSTSEKPQDETEEIFWACGDPIEPTVHVVSADEPYPSPSSAHTYQGTPNQYQTPPAIWRFDTLQVGSTPMQNLARRLPSSTPPRRPRAFRSGMDLMTRTPDPPRPISRQRREVFDVASSGYSKSLEPVSPNTSTSADATWRRNLSSGLIYRDVMSQEGPLGVKRQEVMWEMCETEKAFVKSMKNVLRLFAVPLKTPHGKWIEGIPKKISELFDLLECVVNAHASLVSSQRELRKGGESIDLALFIATFRTWVPRLHMHEWYLLRFEGVVQLVEDNVRDPTSVFGEFVRMQMKHEVLGAMSLGSMLLKPVQRLTKYPLFLKRLLDVTPHPHLSQPDILSLLTKTESIILTLQATKAREDDFQQLSALEGKMQGLPQGFKLAIHGRKLLGHGSVVRMSPEKDSKPTRSRAGSLHSSRGSISSNLSSLSSPWDFHSSLTPSTCRTSAFSTASSSSSFCAPSRTNSLVQTSPQRASVSRSPSSASSMADGRPTTPSSTRSKARNEDILTMLIFDDLVILGTPISEKGFFGSKKKGDKTLRVLSEYEGGVGKVIDVKDWSGWQGHNAMFSLTVVPPDQPPTLYGPITNAFILASGSASSKAAKSMPGPALNSLHQIMTMLSQATSGTGSTPGQYNYESEEKEMLSGLEGLNVEM